MSMVHHPVDALSLCFINSLPVEVLFHIFTIVLEAIPEKSRCESTVPLTLSHTCRSWHDVALEGRTLWIYVPLFSESIACLYLERSSPLPVIIQYSYSKYNSRTRYADAFRRVLRDLSRVRKLLHVENAKEWKHVVDGLHGWDETIYNHSSAPLLEALQLVRIKDSKIFRSRLFNNSTPHAMRELHLYFCDLPRDHTLALFAPAITCLEIVFCSNAWSCLARCLEEMVCLEVLKVRQHQWEEPTNPQPFTIPDSLKLVEMTANSAALVSFFRAALIPLQSIIHVAAIDEIITETSRQTLPLMITDVVDAVFSRISTSLEHGVPYEWLSILDAGPDSTEIRMGTKSARGDWQPSGKVDPYTTALKLAHTRRDFNHELAFGALIIALTQLKSIRSFGTLRTLRLSLTLLDDFRYAHVWRAVANFFPDVERIVLRRTGLIRVLGEENYKDIFPSLKLVLLCPGVGAARSIVMRARQNREDIRIASADLLPYFPDHNLPFDDDID